MSDNYGSAQPRVLDTDKRSWDSVVLLSGVPAVSSDINLLGQSQSERIKMSTKASMPSGWLSVGNVRQVADYVASEPQASNGQVLTSESYPPYSFNLVSRGDAGLAVVNGFVLDVRGTGTAQSDNYITMPSMAGIPSGRVDLVFLESWRELVDKDAAVYPYGNDGAVTTLANDILPPSYTYQTSARVQAKYRIRTSTGPSVGGIDLGGSPDGLGPTVYAQGALPDGGYSTYGFNPSTSDSGLWVAGDGSDAARLSLGTVDGYAYAIPMFAVYRRGASAGFTSSLQDTAQALLAGSTVADRPDRNYLDAVYANDIIDLRHNVSAISNDLTSTAEKTFRQAVSGLLGTRRGLARGNTGYTEAPGGSMLTKGEELGSDITTLPLFGAPVSGMLNRQAYCNSGVSRATILAYDPGTAWVAGVYNAIVVINPGTPASLASAGTAYLPSLYASSDFTVAITSPTTISITVPPGSSFIGVSAPAKIPAVVNYTAGQNGLLDVPSAFLECRQNLGGSLQRVIPLGGKKISIPGNALASLDYLEDLGAELSTTHRRGIDIAVHVTLSAPTATSVTLVGGLLHGHEVTGIKSIQREVSPGVYGQHQTFEALRNIIGSDIEYILQSISQVTETSSSVRLTFVAKTKFFEVSRQGRGVTDTFETIFVTPTRESGSFRIDTGDKEIVSVGAHTRTLSGYTLGTSYAWVAPLASPGNSVMTDITGVMRTFPTKATITFSGVVDSSAVILVPVVVRSYVTSGDSFSFFYTTRGYQGTSSSIGTAGSVLGKTSAVITSQGSGAVADLSYGLTAIFTSGSRTVTALSGNSFGPMSASGDYLYRASLPRERYRISSVSAGLDTVTLEEPYAGVSTGSGGELSTVFRKDIPQSSTYCVLDRLPSYANDCYHGVSAGVVPYYSLLGTSESGPSQDPLDAYNGDVLVGSGTSVERGRNGMLLSVSSENPVYGFNPYPHVLYQPTAAGVYKKVFQGYIFEEAVTGRMLLTIITGENCQTIPNNYLMSSNIRDTVDTFELVGRPLSRR